MRTKLYRFFVASAVMVGAALTSFVSSSCDVIKQVQGAYNMVNCKYDFRSLSAISVAGIDLSKGLSLMDAPKIVNLLKGGTTSLPIGVTVNLDVQNPGTSDAILNGMEYVLAIDGIDFTSGSLARQLSIAPNGMGVMPLEMTFDVAKLLSGESRDAVLGVVRNFFSVSGVGSSSGLGSTLSSALGSSTEPSKVTLNIRPSFDVGGKQYNWPSFIPVSFSFGGK